MRTTWSNRVLRSSLGVAIVLSLQACGCTVIGCNDGLLVRLSTQPTGPFQVELLVAGALQPAPPEATCIVATGCITGILFRTVATDLVVVRVTTSVGTRDTAYPRLQYITSSPNGKGCGPTCRSVTVTANIAL